jgi:hypothetical protein
MPERMAPEGLILFKTEAGDGREDISERHDGRSMERDGAADKEADAVGTDKAERHEAGVERDILPSAFRLPMVDASEGLRVDRFDKILLL